MFTNKDASSSSEDETSTDALREACDDTFFPDSLFSKSASSSTSTHDSRSEVKEATRPSLRITDRSDTFATYGISQSFKDFVAKKLNDKLERYIELHDGSKDTNDKAEKKRKKPKRVNSAAGIKLLSRSCETIVNVETPNDKIQQPAPKPWKRRKESEATIVAKCREVAVDPEWILSKSETRAWNERQRGVVFKYERGSNGVLTERT